MAASSFSHVARVCDRRTRDQQDTSHIIFKVFAAGTWPVYVKGEVILKPHGHLTRGGGESGAVAGRGGSWRLRPRSPFSSFVLRTSIPSFFYFSAYLFFVSFLVHCVFFFPVVSGLVFFCFPFFHFSVFIFYFLIFFFTSGNNDY